MAAGRSTERSGINGKAYEYACVIAIKKAVNGIRPLKVVANNSLNIAKNHFLNDITDQVRADMEASASAGVAVILSMEPRILEDGDDTLTIEIQPDTAATQNGDIRDVLIIRRNIQWEIGISLKHNHEALKHSRLSTRLNFGDRWYGISSSDEYFNDIKPIFEWLKKEKDLGRLWNELDDKELDVYVPILNAFKKEIIRAYEQDKHKVMKGLLIYLLGSNGNDYYKLIHYNYGKTKVIPYNLNKTLNQSSKDKAPDIKIPDIELPTRIIELDFKEGSNTTLILTMNNGWAISFRIHNASSRVEASLKFDIKLQGQPANLYFLEVDW